LAESYGILIIFDSKCLELCNYRGAYMEFKELIPLKKTNKRPKAGDIFALCPQKDLYCFGKVIQTNIESNDSFMRGMNLIYIYDFFSHTMDLPENLESQKLLIVEVVNHQLWRKGFAENIYYSEVSEEDLTKDIAFWNVVKKEYVTIKGNRTDHIPQIKGIFGLGSFGSIGRQLKKILSNRIID